jgi:predicted metal-dependent RNase
MENLNIYSGAFSKKIDNDLLEVVPLGGGREVGRSCIMVKFKGKLIMVQSSK